MRRRKTETGWSKINGMRLCVFLLLSALLPPSSLAALDRGADGKFHQRRSAHFRLLQDVDIDHRTGRGGSRQFEQAVIEALEDAFRQVHKKLDIRPRGAVDVVVYDPAVFDGTYSDQFRFSTVGFYDGVIHVRGDVEVNRRLVRTLHHEYFHAALDAVSPRGHVPAWLNEGLARVVREPGHRQAPSQLRRVRVSEPGEPFGPMGSAERALAADLRRPGQ